MCDSKTAGEIAQAISSDCDDDYAQMTNEQLHQFCAVILAAAANASSVLAVLLRGDLAEAEHRIADAMRFPPEKLKRRAAVFMEKVAADKTPTVAEITANAAILLHQAQAVSLMLDRRAQGPLN